VALPEMWVGKTYHSRVRLVGSEYIMSLSVLIVIQLGTRGVQRNERWAALDCTRSQPDVSHG
jgi:hypothetical protein